MNRLIIYLCLLALPAFGQGHIMEALESNPPDRCVRAATFNEGQGAKDWSDSDAATTISGADFSGTNGIVGGGYNFNRVATNVIDVGEPYHGLNNYTTALWFKTTEAVSVQNLIIGYNDNGPENNIGIIINDAGAITALDERQNTAVFLLTDETGFNDGAWHFVAVTSVRNGTLIIYVDGLNIESSGGVANLGIINNTDNVGLGARGMDGGWNSPFSGCIDECTIFSRALSAIEIKDLYQKGLGK